MPLTTEGTAMTQSTPSPAADPKRYKNTVNLPATAFAMKANLVQSEPASQKRWEKQGLYPQIRAARRGAKPFVFHDGPPYANGDIHLGHLLNKCLKDFVVRTRTMMGEDCPYTPGWDCHGLPIEHKVMQELGPAAREMEALQIRRKCKSYADKFVKTQKGQMQRLLTLADYEDPYLTMLPKFEAGVLEVFAGMVEKGLVYRQLKPVHWSVDNQTALAEAELEYYDREDTSVFVKFERTDGQGHLMIWTTTPWTLPANLAVACHQRFTYGEYAAGDTTVWLATDLAPKVLALGGITAAEPLRTVRGEELLNVTYRHPFIAREGRVVHAEYVTLEDGTGLVHTAPGHGTEDYQTGLREKLEIYCPVLPDGSFDQTAPDWLVGKSIWEGSDLVCEKLEASGHLFHQHKFLHSYPHDWRGKKPVIFRATEQWFVGVDLAENKGTLVTYQLGPNQREMVGENAPVMGNVVQPTLRTQALNATSENIRFIPEWGRNRMRGMLESRPDWCISRQRAWGLPIPAFFGPEGEQLLTAASVRAVARVFSEKGSDAWFFMDSADLLEHYDPAEDDEKGEATTWIASLDRSKMATLRKGGDTFDVWFESGSSWHACMRSGWRERQALRPETGEPFPTDLYLEGSDQHRGWFQHSLLPALAVTGQSPFKAVLTHGFMVDKDGRKMSKSLGNALNVDELLKDFGADVCRWWVSSLNTDSDIKVDPSFFKVAGEEYRKVRNTIRFLLSNLGDFDPKRDAVAPDAFPATSLESWVMGQYVALAGRVQAAYANFQFRAANRDLFAFCNETLSSVYLAAVKDRLYCDRVDTSRRRRTQSAIYRITSGLIRLLAPVLPHTADEAWAALQGAETESVHLATFPSCTGCATVPVDERWAAVMEQLGAWTRQLETARQQLGIDNPLDAGLVLQAIPAGFDPVDLADLCGISRVRAAAAGEPQDEVRVEDLRELPRCERSWKRDGTVKLRSDGGQLSDRDAEALGV